jgi:integrase/recombinase XerD
MNYLTSPIANKYDPPTGETLISSFIKFATDELGLSPLTLEAYENDLRRYSTYLADLGVAIVDADVNVASSYLQSLSKANYATASVLRFMLSVQTFYGYLLEKGLVKLNPIRLLDLPVVVNKLPDVLSKGLVNQLIASVDTRDRFALRDTAILQMFYASGLRVSELVNLKLGDWYPRLGFLKLGGKGNKDRVVPMHPEAGAALEAYVETLRPKLVAVITAEKKDPTERTFLSRAGRPLTRIAVWQLVQRAAAKAGIRPIHPHTLRHTMASHLLSGGADLRVIQEILGHQDVATTQKYTHVDLEHLKKIHKLHPRQ